MANQFQLNNWGLLASWNFQKESILSSDIPAIWQQAFYCWVSVSWVLSGGTQREMWEMKRLRSSTLDNHWCRWIPIGRQTSKKAKFMGIQACAYDLCSQGTGICLFRLYKYVIEKVWKISCPVLIVTTWVLTVKQMEEK